MSKQNETPDDDDGVRAAIEQAIEGSGLSIMPQDEFASVMETMKQNVEASDEEAKQQGKRFLDEEQDQELIETWWKEAERCRSIDDATHFAHRLVEDYRHDYGTICHAVAAAGVAMANAVGIPAGITGFQAGFIGWMLHKRWQQWGDEPRRIVDFSHLLYPQYDDQWASISPETETWLVGEAKKLIGENVGQPMSSAVLDRWQMVARGELPAFVRMVPS